MKPPKIKLMEVCGTHTMAIAAAGIKKILPPRVKLISGPGCPVCVTSQDDIDYAVEVARQRDVIMTTFGDMIRVPGSKASLESARREGAKVKVVYSCLDALTLAQDNPDKKIVFMGVGCETTSPTVAATILEAKRRGIKNFFVLANFKLIFPALDLLCRSKRVDIDGFICPGHVSVVTGSLPYESISKRYKRPCVITGFAPADIVKGITRLIKQITAGKSKVEIEYKRAVTKQGNLKAQKALKAVFRVSDARWRGLGLIKKSGLFLNKAYKDFDAKLKFKIKMPKAKEPKGCLCGKVLQGIRAPLDCRLFKKVCTPANPVGPCMVSSEGTCAAYYKYGK